MYERIFAPLTFRYREKEIIVEDIGALRKVFKKEFYPQLVAYLRNRELERFFSALGMHQIKETIEKLRNSGDSELELINKVAELIGAEPIPAELSQGVCFARHKNLLRELKDTDQIINLTLSSHVLKAQKLELKGSKVFKGNGATELTISASEIKGAGKLVFEDLEMVIDDDTVFEGFEEVRFKNVKLKAEFSISPIRFVSTNLTISECDVIGCLHVENTKLIAEGSRFHDSSTGALIATESSLSLKGCKIDDNADYVNHKAQIYLSGSEAGLFDCEIAKGLCRGLYFEYSKVSLIRCKVYENHLQGIYADESSHLHVEECHVYKNGGSQLVQIYVENSTAHVKNSSIYDSKTAGILVSEGEAYVSGCKIYKNENHAILIEDQSKLKVEKCDIYENSIANYSQLYIENSTATVKDSRIENPMEKTVVGLFTLNSKVSVEGCHICKSSAGISSTEKSELNIEKCNLYENKTSLFMSGSKAFVSECKIYNNEEQGIYVLDKSKLRVRECDLYGNGRYGYPHIHIENSTAVLESLQIHNAEGNGVIILNGAKVNIQNCHIYENGTAEYTPVDTEDYLTFAEIEKHLASGETLQMEDMPTQEIANGRGIFVDNSKVSVIGCNIYRNSQGGISAQEGAEINVEKCDIYENSLHEHSQVIILSSTAVIKDSQIHDSKEGYGLSASGSKVSLIGCKIYQNSVNGIWVVEKSKLNMENSVVYRNSNEETEHPQVYIENSIAVIENSGVHESLGHSYGIYLENSAVLLYKVETSGNQYGVYVENGSVAIHECSIEDGVFN